MRAFTSPTHRLALAAVVLVASPQAGAWAVSGKKKTVAAMSAPAASANAVAKKSLASAR